MFLLKQFLSYFPLINFGKHETKQKLKQKSQNKNKQTKEIFTYMRRIIMLYINVIRMKIVMKKGYFKELVAKYFHFVYAHI